jgi:hypothetical protein
MGDVTDRPEDAGLDINTPTKRDQDDLNRELLGANASRQSRFFPGDAADLYGDSEKAKSERAYRSLLDMLLAEDPQYAALYNRVSEKIIHASRATDQALIEANHRLEESVEMLQKYRESAAELPDGTKVFRSSEDGHIYTEDGRRLTDDEAQGVSVPDDASSWEDYKALREAIDRAERDIQEIERYKREVLQPAQEQMSNPNHPPSKEELETLNEELDAQMPDTVRTQYEAEIAANFAVSETGMSVAHQSIEPTRLDVPDLSKSFDLASGDSSMPELAPAVQPGASNTLG